MDKSEDKKFPSSGGVAFLPTRHQCDIQWCMKYQSVKLCHVLQHEPSVSPKGRKEGGLFCHKNQTCSKSPEMDRSKVKKFSLILRGGLFCHKNQSCSKLPEMDKSEVKKISLILGRGGFSANLSTMWYSMMHEISVLDVTSCAATRAEYLTKRQKKEGGDFSATKTKLAQNHLKWIDPKSKNFPSSWRGLFCHKNQTCSKLPEIDRSKVKKFSLMLGGGFSATKTKLAQNSLKWINLKSKFFPSSWGGDFSANLSPMWYSMMHEISVREVTSCAATRAKYLTKR